MGEVRGRVCAVQGAQKGVVAKDKCWLGGGLARMQCVVGFGVIGGRERRPAMEMGGRDCGERGEALSQLIRVCGWCG